MHRPETTQHVVPASVFLSMNAKNRGDPQFGATTIDPLEMQMTILLHLNWRLIFSYDLAPTEKL